MEVNSTTTDFRQDKCCFSWKVTKFDSVRKLAKLPNSKRFEFKLGSRIGHPTKWRICLEKRSVGGKSWIGYVVYLLKPFWMTHIVKVKYGVSIYNPNDPLPEGWALLTCFPWTRGWKHAQMLQTEIPLQELYLLEDDSLEFFLEFTLLVPKPKIYRTEIVSKVQSESAKVASVTRFRDIYGGSFLWKIKNFNELHKYPAELIEEYQFTFEVDDVQGLPTKWKVYLQLESPQTTVTAPDKKAKTKKEVRVYLKLVECAKGHEDIDARFQLQYKVPDRPDVIMGAGFDGKRDWRKGQGLILNLNDPIHDNLKIFPVLPDGSVELELFFEMYRKPKIPQVEGVDTCQLDTVKSQLSSRVFKIAQ